MDPVSRPVMPQLQTADNLAKKESQSKFGSGLCSNGLTMVMNEPEPKGSSSFKGRTIKILVAARQYDSGSYLLRGYGDIASGVRGLCKETLS